MTLSTIRPATPAVSTGAPPGAAAGPDDAIATWRAWRTGRAAELRRPHGWLSLAGFAWLPPSAIGVPGLPGRWSADDEAVTLTARPGDGLHLIGDAVGVLAAPAAHDPFVLSATGPLAGTVRIPLADGASVTAVRHGERHVELLRRAGRPALRIRDPHAATRTGFRGIPTFDWDENWVVPARFVPTPEPVAEVVLTARPDLLTTATTHGRVDFTVQGTAVFLAATLGGNGELSIGFRDRTNEVLTAPWRVLTTAPVDQRQPVVLDFNRAVNPPFAFTAFGTCPAPVAANRLPVAVPAGEQAPLPPGTAR